MGKWGVSAQVRVLGSALIVMALSLSTIVPARADDVVTIPDPGFAKCVATALHLDAGTTAFTTAQLGSPISELDCHQLNIRDITGAGYLKGTFSMYFDGNQISDISPLRDLGSSSQLFGLWLDNNLVTDLSPLEGLSQLGDISAVSNQIRSVAPLAELTKLQALWLSNNQVSDLSPLAGLSRLEILGIGANQIVDVTPLSQLAKLDRLYLGSNQIRDVRPLTALPSLSVLVLSSNLISDISSFPGKFPGLESLDLSNNLLATLPYKANCPPGIRLNGNQLFDLSACDTGVDGYRTALNEHLTATIPIGKPASLGFFGWAGYPVVSFGKLPSGVTADKLGNITVSRAGTYAVPFISRQVGNASLIDFSGTVTITATAAAKAQTKLRPGRIKVGGKLKVGHDLWASHGAWKPAPTVFLYRWYRGKRAVGVTSRWEGYTAHLVDRGKRLTVKVWAFRRGYVSVAATSKPTKKIKK
jgi:hypothetical protein